MQLLRGSAAGAHNHAGHRSEQHGATVDALDSYVPPYVYAVVEHDCHIHHGAESMTLRLIDLEAPLDDVEFPNGAKHQPTPFGAAEYRLWRDIQTEPDAESRGMMLMQIVGACYPTAAPDDLESCTPKMLIALAAHAGRKIDQVRDALKNVGAVEAEATAAPLPVVETAVAPSSPRTSGATSSRKSRGRSGKSGGASTTASRTDAPSTSGTVFITSTTPNASTHFVESSTTSTAPS
jgi:hypothetical protein